MPLKRMRGSVQRLEENPYGDDLDRIASSEPLAMRGPVVALLLGNASEYGSDYAVGLSETELGHLEAYSLKAAVLLERTQGRSWWWFRNEIIEAPADYTGEMVELEIWDVQRRRDARFERLRKIRAREEDTGAARRERIPDEVRAFVWERDEGRCVRCRAEDDLQFDHIIPVAKGGGNGIENVQILCGDCNRLKSDSII